MKIDDAYGHAVYDYFHGKSGYEIIEREDGFIFMGGALDMYFNEYETWDSCQKKAIQHAKGRVLDIGSGPGKHSLYLQNQGFDVVATDISALAIDVCRLRGVRNAKVIPVTGLDSSLGKFDTILMMGNNFGVLGNVKRARWLLKRFHSMSSENAVIIAESKDPYQLRGAIHEQYLESNRSRGRMPGQRRIRIRYLNYATPWFDDLRVSKEEMEEILVGTGWYVRKFMKSFGPAYYGALLAKKTLQGEA